MCFLLHSRHALFNRRGRVLARHVKQKNNSECLGVVPFIFIFRNVPVFDFLLAEIACATWQKNKKDILCVVLFACVIVGMRLSWLCNLVCLLALSLSLSLSRKHTHTHTHTCSSPCTCLGYLFQCTIEWMHYIHHRTLFRFESGSVSLLAIQLPDLIAWTRIALTAHCCDSVNFYGTLATECNTMFHFPNWLYSLKYHYPCDFYSVFFVGS